jgi:3-deoxy-D-manno-octulosonate 8-phosphate phosphatase (KDO 8-P phosphatase)
VEQRGLGDLAREIKAVISNVDGVFTDNRVLEGASYKAKWRSYYDGQGVSLLRAIGLRVCLITNEKGHSAKHIIDVVEKWNNLPSSEKSPGDGGWHHVKLYLGMGGEKKVVAAEEWLKEIGLSFKWCAFMGDDLVDVPLLQKVALRVAPISADPVIKKMAHFVSERVGGMGAFRDFANFILEARRIDPLSLPPQ